MPVKTCILQPILWPGSAVRLCHGIPSINENARLPVDTRPPPGAANRSVAPSLPTSLRDGIALGVSSPLFHSSPQRKVQMRLRGGAAPPSSRSVRSLKSCEHRSRFSGVRLPTSRHVWRNPGFTGTAVTKDSAGHFTLGREGTHRSVSEPQRRLLCAARTWKMRSCLAAPPPGLGTACTWARVSKGVGAGARGPEDLTTRVSFHPGCPAAGEESRPGPRKRQGRPRASSGCGLLVMPFSLEKRGIEGCSLVGID